MTESPSQPLPELLNKGYLYPSCSTKGTGAARLSMSKELFEDIVKWLTDKGQE